jgi:histidinol phosphatase-like enzyme (inositol monophosphatase family)
MTAVDPGLLDEAVELARAAGRLTLRWFRTRGLAVDRKGDGTPVTEADRAAERLLREEIARRHPDDAIVGEEEAPRAGTSGRTWIVDPIDGTKSFTRGVPLFSTLVAVDDGEGPAVGVIDLPALGQTVYAGRGRGCFADGEPASVSATGALRGAYVSSSSFGHWDPDLLLRLRRAGADLRTWGDGYGYALVATGRIDVMIDPVAAHWDLAPMPVILAEAGGRFSGWDGSAGARAGSGVASNGALHDDVLALLRAG